jgi:hypothetical protein
MDSGNLRSNRQEIPDHPDYLLKTNNLLPAVAADPVKLMKEHGIEEKGDSQA